MQVPEAKKKTKPKPNQQRRGKRRLDGKDGRGEQRSSQQMADGDSLDSGSSEPLASGAGNANSPAPASSPTRIGAPDAQDRIAEVALPRGETMPEDTGAGVGKCAICNEIFCDGMTCRNSYDSEVGAAALSRRAEDQSAKECEGEAGEGSKRKRRRLHDAALE